MKWLTIKNNYVVIIFRYSLLNITYHQKAIKKTNSSLCVKMSETRRKIFFNHNYFFLLDSDTHDNSGTESQTNVRFYAKMFD